MKFSKFQPILNKSVLAGIFFLASSSHAAPANTQTIQLSAGSRATVYAFENTVVTCGNEIDQNSDKPLCKMKPGSWGSYSLYAGEEFQGNESDMDKALARLKQFREAGICR